MQHLNIDTIGPFEVDADNNKYIIVIIDTFTRYVVLHPAKTLEAKECAHILFKHLCRFGVPDEILTDNGTQYINKELEDLFGLTERSHIRITPYSHQENGIVERVNKEVIRHLRNTLFDNRVYNSWSKYVPMVERIINTTRHSETGQVPAHLVFSNIGINLDRHVLHKSSDDSSMEVEPSTYGAQLLQHQQTLVDLARTTQKDNINTRMQKKKPTEPTTFEPGSYVLRQHPNGRTTKLDPKHTRPFEVVQQPQNKCELKDYNGNVIQVHIKELRPYVLNGIDKPGKSLYAIKDFSTLKRFYVIAHQTTSPSINVTRQQRNS
jgi:hypothetical protein